MSRHWSFWGARDTGGDTGEEEDVEENKKRKNGRGHVSWWAWRGELGDCFIGSKGTRDKVDPVVDIRPCTILHRYLCETINSLR